MTKQVAVPREHHLISCLRAEVYAFASHAFGAHRYVSLLFKHRVAPLEGKVQVSVRRIREVRIHCRRWRQIQERRKPSAIEPADYRGSRTFDPVDSR